MRRILALLLVAISLCVMLLVPVSGAVSLSFIAVNDFIPLTLSGDQRPFYSGGALYVPYTAFNASSLGFYPSYSAADKLLTLYGRDTLLALVFDLSAGTVTDEGKTVRDVAAVSKNGTVFLPAAFCAAHFGVGFSELTSQGGYQIVRFTTGTQVYDDSLFVEKAENLIAYRVSQFLTPTAPATPGVPVTPVTPNDPEKPVEPELDPVSIYLAIVGAQTLQSDLSTLDRHKLKATFFLSAQEIADNADLVRRLVSEGHYIGLTATEPDDPAAQLHQANDALDAATQTKSLLALLPEGAAQPELQTLYRVFAQPARRLTATEALKAVGQTRLMICDGQTLSESLRILTGGNCNFLPLRETSQLD